MAMLNYSGSLRYSKTGKKRKTKSMATPRRPRKEFVPLKVEPNIQHQRSEEFRKKYPSLDTGACSTQKVESQKYTGDLITGIATMHKSNAVPVMKGTDQAKDIARMRR